MVLLNVPFFNEILLDSCSVNISQDPLHFDCTFESAIQGAINESPHKNNVHTTQPQCCKRPYFEPLAARSKWCFSALDLVSAVLPTHRVVQLEVLAALRIFKKILQQPKHHALTDLQRRHGPRFPSGCPRSNCTPQEHHSMEDEQHEPSELRTLDREMLRMIINDLTAFSMFFGTHRIASQSQSITRNVWCSILHRAHAVPRSQLSAPLLGCSVRTHVRRTRAVWRQPDWALSTAANGGMEPD